MLHIEINIATALNLNRMVEHIHATYTAHGGFDKLASINSSKVHIIGILILGSPQTNRNELEQTFTAQAGPTKIRLTKLIKFLKEPETLETQCRQHKAPPKDVIMVEAPKSHFEIITNYLRKHNPKIKSQNPPPAYTYPTCRRAKSNVTDLLAETAKEIINIHHQHITSELSWTEVNL